MAVGMNVKIKTVKNLTLGVAFVFDTVEEDDAKSKTVQNLLFVLDCVLNMGEQNDAKWKLARKVHHVLDFAPCMEITVSFVK
eukprot:CAMPEP_0204831584 /NCGR_PEP_ID=MMETSP1346-20131115/10888_1 /ASSEMBLY_ACC=CAM_ASM_000771 /TAXON_ID=215587 /ORGANISM="Aplanochytrium stocchinoi, Strain GSBS06" /LENGTH=81 /DNA_ID=CAMNT_0051962693 /DNA_START=1170 /DNA_END=1415 /DNA_ORIENTATION=-